MSTALPIADPAALRESRWSLRIGDLAKRAHKSTRAVRLYEDLGLLGPALRTEGGHRLYDEDALIRLSWIDKLQLLGFSLQEIRSFLDELEAAKQGPQAMEKVGGMFRSKLHQVRAQIETLEALALELSDSLTYLQSCNTCAPSTVLHECKCCDQPHPIEPPMLITGIHTSGEGSEKR